MLEKQSVYQKLTSLRIIYNKVIGGFWFDLCQELKKYPAKTEKKDAESFGGSEKSRTFAPA